MIAKWTDWRLWSNEEEMDYFEELSCWKPPPFYPDKPGAYRKVYRLDMTQRKIKRRLRELTKYWESTDWIWVWNEYRFAHSSAILSQYSRYNKPNKFYMQPHRMHKKYAYESDEHDDWDYYAYLYYNRGKRKTRDIREQNNPQAQWYHYDEPLTCVCCNEDTWGWYEGSDYYEVDSYYWREWQRGWWEDSMYDEGWEYWPVYFEKEQYSGFYKAAYRMSVQSRQNLSYMIWLTSKGE